MNLVEHEINKLNQKEGGEMEYKEMFVPSLIQLAVDVKNKEEAF